MPQLDPIKPAFCKSITSLLPDEAEALLASLETEPIVSVRFNRRKPCETFVPFHCRGLVPWSNGLGHYLSERPSFTADPLWHAGGYYVQEASSMLLSHIAPYLGEEPLKALDLCAAPGGKSTLLLDLLPPESALVSNEIIRPRAQVLAENLLKWGDATSLVTSTEPRMLGKLKQSFDLILVDAPCSGEGMFRKDNEARTQWSEELVRQCAERQRSILEDIWPTLRPGGLLVYSTCTFNRLENEDMVQFILDELGAVALPLGDLPSEVTPSTLADFPCYRMMPHRTEGEGLFLALLRKHGEQETATHRKASKGKTQTRTQPPQEAATWLCPEVRESLVWQRPNDDLIVAMPPQVAQLADELKSYKIPILTAGVQVAEAKGRDFLPHPALALSECLAPDAFPSVELSHEEAIRYLAREAVALPEATPRGWVLVRYKGLALGFMKHLGTRSNNLYPQAWRIRHPEQMLSLIEAK